jgi:hypothetical protein
MTYHYLYKITNTTNGKIYLGIHSTDNLDDGYFGSGTAFKKAITKYGKDNFIKENLEYFDTRAQLVAREEELVNDVFVDRADTYNITTGGYRDASSTRKGSRNTIGRLSKKNTSGHPNISKYTRRIKGKSYLYWRLRLPFNGKRIERLFPFTSCGLKRAIENRDALFEKIEII